MGKVHELWADEQQALDPLSPARERLRQAIAALDEATRSAENSAAPLHRLNRVIAEADQTERELAILEREDEAVLGEWIAQGSIAARPKPSAATVAAKTRLAESAPDIRGATAALPAAQEMQQAGVAAVTAAATERDLALYVVAIEAAATVAQEFTAALNHALQIEARLLSLRDALGARSDHGGGGIEKVTDLIRTAKASAGVPRNSEAGRRLLEALMRDPTAVL